MKRAIILHGTAGSPEGNWFRWLEQELVGRGYEVWLPLLPEADHPSLTDWLGYVTSQCPFPLDEHVLVIGHSSGAILGLLLLQHFPKIASYAGVSVFMDNSLGWEANDRLFDESFDYAVLKNHHAQRLLVGSDTDPYVPLAQPQAIARESNTELVVIPNQGHFNLEQSQDYHHFPELLTLLMERSFI